MTIARRLLVESGKPGWYHCISRCVRRAFLCGDGFAHRKSWVEERLRLLAECFAVEVGAYAVMSNHLHVVARIDPQAVAGWTDLEVARRWCAVYPSQYLRDGTPVPASAEELQAHVRDGAWVVERRRRLGELGWFMKALKEPIARRANREDGCTGAFWEGRFTSVALLDQSALLACLAYVDLNPVRAGIADRPEASAHTSVRTRARARQAHVRFRTLAQRRGEQPARALCAKQGQPAPAGPEEGMFLAPMARCTVDAQAEELALAGMVLTPDRYLELVDLTGRALRAGKRGTIPPGLAPILERLRIDVRAWLAAMERGGAMRGTALGGHAARAGEAVRRGCDWLADKSGLFPRGRDAAA